MDGTVYHSFRSEFARRAALKREQDFRREQERQEKERDRREDQADTEFAEFAGAVLLATPEEIASFTVRLDQYDTAVVEALYANQVALEDVRREIDQMLMRAHVLPDGRRVFETEDGLRVIDEHGQEVSREEIAPEDLDDTLPRWEAYRAAREQETQLLKEREQIHEYQTQLDDARRRLDDDDLTQDDLEALDTRLQEAMPDTVRQALERSHHPQTPQPPEQSQTEQPLDLGAIGRTLAGSPPQLR